MSLVTDVLGEWAREEPAYEQYGAFVERELRRVLRNARIPYERMSVRTKERNSLAKKVLRKEYEGYADVSDKVGARVVVRVPSDVDRVVEVVGSHFSGSIEDKRNSPDPRIFDYRSVHIQICGLPGTRDFDGLECEIQVRTVVEDAWAVMSHFINYKGVLDPPPARIRALAALAALFELADMRYEELLGEIVATPGYEALSVISDLEGVFLSLGGDTFDRTLSQDVIDTLLPAYGDRSPKEIAESIAAWAEASRSWLSEKIENRRRAPDSSVFLGQPEVLMIGELLHARSSALLPLWAGAFETEELEGVAREFSYAIPGLPG